MASALAEHILNEKRKSEARNRRFKKAICRDLNYESIKYFIWETLEAAGDVAYASQNDEVLLDVMDGNEEEAFEFRAAFGTLMADLEHFKDDLYDGWIPDCFDDFFAGIGGDGGPMLGFDTYEGDYFGLDDGFESRLACQEAGNRLMRMTKKDLIEAAGQCFRIAIAFVGLRARFEDLQAALDIIRAKNDGILSAVKRIEELYDQANQKGFGEWDNDAEREFSRLVRELPDECWIR